MSKLINFFIIIITILSIQKLSAQNKQGNTANAEIFADAPYRMKKTDSLGNIKAIPINIFAHDADGVGANIQLMSIDIKIKNATDTNFTSILDFNDISDTAFSNLLINRSTNNPIIDMQNFNNSGFQKTSLHSVEFTETHDIIDGEDYVVINSKFWYFTIMIPPEKLIGFDDIIDINVYFNIDWSVDDETSLRIFRTNDNLPKLPDWYRGDTHYHTMFTQNLVETGEPLSATKQAGKYIGLDWQFTTDHSCDFDNYGQSMDENWTLLGNKIENLNNNDSSYIFIRGIEMSVNNSEGKIVHALIYPSDSAPLDMPYFGDGGGDSEATSIDLNNLLDSLTNYNAICYAAHPFAELDKLPDLINGSVWNINDANFPENGQAHPSNGTVICNNIIANSDIFSNQSNKLFNDNLKGFQVWNLYNTLTSTSSDNYYNPWNISYDTGIGSFSLYDDTNDNNYMYRFEQGMDVMRFLFQKSLIEKNTNQNLQNWKTFISAGSDAHGSFNYSNTNMYYANYGTVENNALGKLSTLAYCPNGMGANGKNILFAIKNGNTIISDGPIISLGIDTDNDYIADIIIGSDTSLTVTQMQNYNLVLNYENTLEFGDFHSAKLYFGTEQGESSIILNFTSNALSYNLYDIINNFYFGNIPDNEYFYFRAELTTKKIYDLNSDIYKMQEHYFHSYTNPIWIKKSITSNIESFNNKINKIYISQDNEDVFVHFNLQSESQIYYSVYNTLGQKIIDSETELYQKGNNKISLNKANLKSHLYIIKISVDGKIYAKKIVF